MIFICPFCNLEFEEKGNKYPYHKCKNVVYDTDVLISISDFDLNSSWFEISFDLYFQNYCMFEYEIDKINPINNKLKFYIETGFRNNYVDCIKEFNIDFYTNPIKTKFVDFLEELLLFE